MHRFLSSWFGVGYLPRVVWGHDGGAGTVGAAAALLPAVLVSREGVAIQIVALGVVVGLALWSIHPFAHDHADPRWVCIDEAAGVFLAVVGLHGWFPMVAAFAVFRLADIPKRFPLVNRAQSLPGAVGVLADDLLAGAYGLGAGWVVQLTIMSVGR